MPDPKPRWPKLVGPVAALVAIGGVARWWDTIAAHPAVHSLIAAVGAHPAVSTLIGLGAAILAAMLAFGGRVRAKLEDKWVDSVADWVDAQVRLYGSLLLSGFRRRYFKQILYRHRTFNVRGLRTQGAFSLELEQVFVELRVAPQSHPHLSPGLLRSQGLTGKRSVWELLASDQSAFRILAVIGPPGSGKTTLLQHLTLTFAQNRQRRHNRRCPAYVPVLLFLRRHVGVVAGDEAPTLAELVTDLEAAEGLKPPPEWFERKLRAGRVLVLLDGLDEVADAGQRRRVVAWVERQTERYGEARFIVTSRPRGYQATPLAAATLLEVQPFTLQQVERFVDGWYLANEVLSAGRDTPEVRQQARNQARELMRRLRATPALAALAVNPLLLTMIAMVHRYRGALPGRRVELFAEICDVLLGHWQAAKGLDPGLTAAQRRTLLQPLAFHLMAAKRRDITALEADEVLRPWRVEIQEADTDGSGFLEGVERGSGLLVEHETGVYGFAHLAFQEYLAAAHLLAEGDATPLLSRVADPWWHETIRLYAAQSDATAILRACLDTPEPTTPALALAYECLAEGQQIAAEVRAEVEQQLVAGLEAPEPERRELAAEVMLASRLRNLLRLSDTAAIDTSYISCAEYQLFLDDQFAAGEHRQPDHWSGIRFAAGTAQQPVAGVRSSDAVEFCQWLSQRETAKGAADYAFRLPTPAEARANPVPSAPAEGRLDSLQSNSVGTWTTGDPPTLAGVSTVGEKLRHEQAKAHAHARNLALDRAKVQTSALPPVDLDLGALDHTPALDHNRALDLDLGRDPAADRRRSLDRALDRALDQIVNRALAHARALPGGPALELDAELALACCIILFRRRIEGDLSAWEGIRIVRERRPHPEDANR